MNNEVSTVEREEIEIDLMELFFIIRKKLWIIILTGICFGLISFGISKFLMTPIYTSSSSFLVLTKETTLSSLADLQMGSQLTNDYRELTVSRPVLQQVIENLGLDMNYKDLKEKITIENPEDTRILVMSVEDPDPKLACTIVDELASVASEFIGEKMEVIPPKIIEKGEVATEKTSPSNLKNTVIGGFLGVMGSAAIIILLAFMDDTIKSEDDIERYLKITNLASVPDRKDYISGKKKSRKNKKKMHIQGQNRRGR